MKRVETHLGARMNAKKCSVCRQGLPVQRRSDQRYCGVRCRVRAHRLRSAGAAVQQTPAVDPEAIAAELAVVTASAAAAALLVETLRGQLKRAEEARETQSSELTKLRGRLHKTEEARLAATHEAAVERNKVSELSHYYYEAEKSISALAREKAQQAQELTTLRSAKQRRPTLSQASKDRQKQQVKELRDSLRDRDKQLRELKRKLLLAEKTPPKQAGAHSPAEPQLRAEVANLGRQLKTAQAEVERLTRSLDKKKNSNKKLKKTLEEEQDRGLLSRLFSGGAKRRISPGKNGDSERGGRTKRVGAGTPESRALPTQPSGAQPTPKMRLPPKADT